ncbi:hypothetical protein JX266_009438 [Neoarthrinium moseri]|nr:hypothetical protein JX266_009438 [Neoarthrinium moseri]
MSYISSIRTRYLAWSHSTPLPDLSDAAPPVFQHWHVFDKSACKWAFVHPNPLNAEDLSKTFTPATQTSHLKLLTWNVDAFGDRHEARMEGILSKLQHMLADGDCPDIVLFQEVSRKALAYLLQNTWVREFWISSEADETNWVDVSFATMTLLSRFRFNSLSSESGSNPESASPVTAAISNGSLLLGPVWRVKYPSRFNRDALCCDIFWNRTTRIRLVNVHLDSLPIQPNQRPRQVAIAASLLRTAGVGRGVIAGDWNTVMEEDMVLAQKNNLIDAWEYLHPGEDGFTWGLDGKGEPFPPGRLDKVAVRMTLERRESQATMKEYRGVITQGLSSWAGRTKCEMVRRGLSTSYKVLGPKYLPTRLRCAGIDYLYTLRVSGGTEIYGISVLPTGAARLDPMVVESLVDPKWKILSEVATLDWVKANTSVPVPRVLAYNADRSTPIGFEWIAMEKMPGKPWADAYRDMAFSAKEEVVRQISRFNSETYQRPLNGIGNIFPGPADAEMDYPGVTQVGRIVSSAFICHGIHRDAPRGPLPSSRHWLEARLDLAALDCQSRLEKAQNSVARSGGKPDADTGSEGESREGQEDEEEQEEEKENSTKSEDQGSEDGGRAENGNGDEDEEDEEDDDTEDLDVLQDALKIIKKLKTQLPNFFPPGGPELEPTILFHDDLNRHNILVNDAGVLTAVVDWECISALPLWAACRYPSFIDGKQNDVEPTKERYPHDENGDVDELYWEHLEDFESAKLGRLFLEEMRRLAPGWVVVFEWSQRQRDFDLAVNSCDDEFSIRRILAWLEDVESAKKDIVSLEERFAERSPAKH